MKKIISLGVSLLIIITMLSACNGGAGSTNGDGSISLKFNFQKGTKYKYIMKNKQEITQSMMGRAITVSMDMDMESTYEVAAAEGANKKLTVTYDRIAMKSNNSSTKMEYDSDDSAHSEPMLKSMGYMLHKPFSMTVNEKGQVVALEGFKELMPGNEGSPISDSSMRSMMQQAFYIYPEKPVKPGDTWNNTYTTSMGIMNLTTDNTYKLVSVSNGVAHIDMNSKIASHPGTDPQTKDMKMELNGTQTGTMDIDVATGLMMGSNLQQDIKGSTDMMGMKTPMQVKTNINIVGAPEK